ncbi:LysM peptidoglycan-binding domain-containing protein [Afipia massiliensis]|uniref:LysM peptidoglycan-binding domain-containing protein n=1 Tax=Afipia massiliensis TaxID=211460 RepID=A0A4U6BTQ1_9BRAD|nr:LysM peptidoglycan-binding domain-containing protein [Afipia massiliensis]TKT72194.1 LysM peptidoglycan-binding domain-containing protein [Afipia massiliensis]
MTAASTGRVIVLSLALVAVCGAALVFGIRHIQREPPVEAKVETRTVIAAPAVTPPASGAQVDGPAALATAQAEANAVTGALAAPPRAPDTDKSAPVFDIARIARTGDAVIAGRAAPGATVELLRNGEPLDRAVADQSGQFVMIPPPLPPGSYDLTLRSSQPGGKQVTSEQKMAVALDAAESSSAAARPRAGAPTNVPETVMANRSAPDQAAGSSQASVPSDKGPRSAIVVSRGDSLWRISRATYGTGMRYPLVLKANRDQIRDPDLIYPGQTFVLPKQAR